MKSDVPDRQYLLEFDSPEARLREKNREIDRIVYGG
jgi:hypothetical protein